MIVDSIPRARHGHASQLNVAVVAMSVAPEARTSIAFVDRLTAVGKSGLCGTPSKRKSRIYVEEKLVLLQKRAHTERPQFRSTSFSSTELPDYQTMKAIAQYTAS